MRSLGDYASRLIGTPYLAGSLLLTAVGVALGILAWRVLSGDSTRGGAPYRALGLGIALTMILVNVWAIGVQWPTGDEPHYLLMAESLLRDHDFDLRNNYEERQYSAFSQIRELDPHIVPVGDVWRPYHGIGLPILIAPFFALAGRPGVAVFLSACTLGAIWLTWLAALRGGFPRPVAAQMVLVAAFTLPVLAMASQVYPEVPALFLVVLAIHALLVRSVTWGVVGALLLSVIVLPWLHVKYLAVDAALLLLTAVRWHGAGERWLPGLVLAACSAAGTGVVLLSLAWYGTLVPGSQYAATMSQNRGFGLAGLLLDQQSGLLMACPVFVLALPGVIHLWKRERFLALLIGAIFLSVYLPSALLNFWSGGTASPARFFTPVIPALSLGIGALMAVGNRPIQRIYAALAIPSFLHALLLAALPAGATRYGDPETTHNFFVALLERATGWDLTWLFPSFQDATPLSLVAAVAYLIAIVALTWLVVRLLRDVHVPHEALAATPS